MLTHGDMPVPNLAAVSYRLKPSRPELAFETGSDVFPCLHRHSSGCHSGRQATVQA